MEAKDFFIKTGLYQLINFDNSTNQELIESIVSFSGTIDIFCPECDKISTYKCDYEHFFNFETILKQEIYKIVFLCTRDYNHKLIIYYRVTPSGFEKIGQYPSIASLESNVIAKYKSILKKDYIEFSKAIGLYSHGIGIGSFVYLRRIFENLIHETYSAHIKDLSIKTEDFFNLRMDERIKLLKEYLPEFLVKNNKIYGILSKAIHSLSEIECLAIFDPIKTGIELILDQKLELVERHKKELEAEKIIQGIAGKIK